MSTSQSEEREALARAARDFLATACPPALVRAAASSTGRIDRALWRGLAEAGFLGVVVPERFGGLGLGHLDLALVLEEIGRAALPAPVSETAVASLALAGWGSDAQKARWLPAIVSGDVVAIVRLDGQVLVADADDADLFVTVCDGALHAAPRDRVEVHRRPHSYGGRHLSAIEIDASPDTWLRKGDATPDRLADAMNVANASVLLGIGTYLLEQTVLYVKERRQFGRAVGSFQAVKHRLADAHVALAMARPSVRAAAHALDAEEPGARDLCRVATIVAASAHAAANEHALQCHGGVGFTQEHDLHLWLTLGKDLERAYGSPRASRAALARSLFDDGNT